MLIFILLLLLSCKQSTEPKLEVEMILELEDVSCTEAWIKLTTNNLQLPATINLIKNNTVAQSFSLSSKDSLLYIDSLLPNQNYKFLVTMQQLNNRSNELSVTTMDTTSHEFSWQSWEFGECSSSSLYDVAIIDENNIWAVGEIYMRDSLGNCDPNAYNAVHWDGTKWELKRIYFPTVCGGTGLSSYPAKAIFAFNDGQIWISTSGDKIAILKDGIQINKFCLPSNVSMSINKLWGSSSEDLYAVGNNGNIAHWDGRKWTKIESGTNLHIYDIWGDYNERIGQWEILAVAADVYNSFEKEVIAIKNSQSYKLSNFGIEEPLMGVWFKCNRKYYLVGSGTYMKTFLSDKEWKGNPRDITNYFENAIRANSTNDVI
ncbi:MAG: glucosyl transferase, partial [Ignavibacteria bacterium]